MSADVVWMYTIDDDRDDAACVFGRRPDDLDPVEIPHCFEQTVYKALIVFHAPRDEVVGIEHATRIFERLAHLGRHAIPFVAPAHADARTIGPI